MSDELTQATLESNRPAKSAEAKLRLALPFVPSRFAPYHSPSRPPDWITREEVEEALAEIVAERNLLREALDDIARYTREPWAFSERFQAILDTIKRVRR